MDGPMDPDAEQRGLLLLVRVLPCAGRAVMTEFLVGKMSTVNIGPNIRLLRAKRGWTLRELATRAGCSAFAVCKWERGETIRAKYLEAVAAALGVSVATLWAPVTEPLPDPTPCAGSGKPLRRIRWSDPGNTYCGTCMHCGIVVSADRGRATQHQKAKRVRRKR